LDIHTEVDKMKEKMYKGYTIKIARLEQPLRFVGLVYDGKGEHVLDITGHEEFAIDAERGAEVLAENLPKLEE
jgi:hypothetical protein